MDFHFKDAKLGTIPLSKIRENTEALRTSVDKESEDYANLVDSVRKRGILNPILVREIHDPVTNEVLYGLIDGLHRYNAAMDAGMTEMPAQIGSLAEGDLIEAQILANVHRIETKPVQYTKALIKVMGSNPLLTTTELASRLSRGTQWVKDRLGLLKLRPEIQALVDDDKITLPNAYALSKLPEDQQTALVNQAMSKTAAEFVPHANAVLKEVQQARREGRKAETDKFVPVQRLQRLAVIKDELGFAQINPQNSKLIASASANGVTTVEGAIAHALAWVLNVDPDSIKRDEEKWKQDKENKAAAAKARAEEKQRIKEKVAAELQAGLSPQKDGVAAPAAAVAAK